MSYYIRVLSRSDQVPSIAKMRAALKEGNLAGEFTIEAGGEADWTQLVLAHKGGPEIAHIFSRNTSSSDVFSGEIEEFLDEIENCKPASAAAWLAGYLPTVNSIFAFQLLSGTDTKNGWDVLGQVKNTIFAEVGGVIQADGEGFTDEEGYHILWQFSNSVTGPWWMAVLKNGAWIHFQMDLGNQKHRTAFFRGEIPEGAKMAN